MAMRSFRDNILQKESRYLEILFEYDTIGPRISKCLKNDELALWIAEQLLEHYLLPIVALINNKDYDAAVVMYQNMVNILKENYGIDDNIEDVDHYDQSIGGHGYAYTKVLR